MAEMTRREVLLALADGKTLQSYNHNHGWLDVKESIILDLIKDEYTTFSYRIKPKTKFINGVEAPMHVTEKPKIGERYFCAFPTSPEYGHECYWGETYIDMHRFNFGMIYPTLDEAIKAGQAMTMHEIK